MSSLWSVRRRSHPRIFISYRRRGEGAGYGGRIADKLVEHFGAEQCFRDVVSIESGVDFVQAIHEAVGACEVLIAVIGPDWTTQTNEKGRRRLDDPRDFVRLEVVAALERGIRVIPVLVGGAEMPAEGELPQVLEALSRRQAHEVTDSRWDYDAGRLVQSIELIGIRPRVQRTRSLPARKLKLAAGIAALGATATLSAAILSKNWNDWNPPLPDGKFSAIPSNADEVNSSRPEPEPKPANEAPREVKTAGVEPSKRARPMPVQKEEVRKTGDGYFYSSVKQWGSGAPELKGDIVDNMNRMLSAISKMNEDSADPGKAAGVVAPAKLTGLPVADRFDGFRGTIHVTWQHEGVQHSAVVVSHGKYGTARVRLMLPGFGPVDAEQDLTLLLNDDGAFYVGSNARVPGTSLPHPAYTPDIFRVGRRPNGTWEITEVGTSWDHFDQAIATVN
jgi:hypothetical protein